MRIFCGLILILFLGIFCKEGSDKTVDEEIQTILAKYRAIGVSVVVVKNNKIIYNRSFGYNPDYNDATRRAPIPTNGLYVIASVSKTFISTAIMQLAERKKLNLDDDVNQYLDFNVRNPKYPDVPITIRMLLDHRSSINDKHYSWNINHINPQKGDKGPLPPGS